MPTVADHVTASPETIEAIASAAEDYIEGYASGDGDRHAAAYHPEAIKRRYVQDADGVFGMIDISPTTMTEYASLNDPADCPFEIFIDDVHEGMVSVRVYSCNWVDFLHVVFARGEWRLLHVTWHTKQLS